MRTASRVLHKTAGAAFPIDIAILVSFLAVKGESPRGFALPVLIAVLPIAALVWWFTRWPDQEEEPKSSGGDTISGHSTTGPASPIYHLENSPVTVAPQEGSPLARGLADGIAELEAIRRALLRADASRELPRKLPDRRHSEIAGLLTDQGWHGSRQILDEAYGATEDLWEKLNVPARRRDGGPIPEMVRPTIEESDDLAGVLGKVEAAVVELRRLQGGQEPAPEEARVEFVGVEVGDSRWIHEKNVFNDDWSGTPIVFNLINPRGGSRARAVRPTVTVRDPDGAVLAGPTNARWANPQPPATEEVEREIPANGAPVAIDTVIQPVGGDRFWLVTDENLRVGLKATQAIDAHDFHVTVSVQGENLAEASHTVRVRLGFPSPAVGDDEPADTMLPPSGAASPNVADAGEGDAGGPGPGAKDSADDKSDERPDEVEDQRPRPTRRGGTASAMTLEKLWIEGQRMLRASGPFGAIGAGVLYGPPPSEADIGDWQRRVRAALPAHHRRRFRFAPLEAEVNRLPVLAVSFPNLESEGARRLRESLQELERIMDALDVP